MNNHITDRRLLGTIQTLYYPEFLSYSTEPDNRSSRIWVPIDIKTVGQRLGLDSEIVFGRLYYHLNKKYGFEQPDKSRINLFEIRVGSDTHAINFPMLSAVVAELNESFTRFTIPLVFSSVALLISILNFVIARLP